jgi:hypothetical protein
MFKKRVRLVLAFAITPLLVGFVEAQLAVAQSPPPATPTPQPASPTPRATPMPLPNVNPTISSPAPVRTGPVPPVPPVRRTTLEINQEAIARLDASRKRELTADVVAIRIRSLHVGDVEIALFHLPTGAQIILSPIGTELRRFQGFGENRARELTATRELEEVLNNASLKAKALELAR